MPSPPHPRPRAKESSLRALARRTGPTTLSFSLSACICGEIFVSLFIFNFFFVQSLPQSLISTFFTLILLANYWEKSFFFTRQRRTAIAKNCVTLHSPHTHTHTRGDRSAGRGAECKMPQEREFLTIFLRLWSRRKATFLIQTNLSQNAHFFHIFILELPFFFLLFFVTLF